MKNILTILFISVMLHFNARAQLVITIKQPSPLQLRATDVVNATLLNSGNLVKLYFTGSIVNTINGKKILDLKTNPLDFPSGITNLNAILLQPTFRYFSESFQISGIAPYGNYEICLQAFSATDNEERGEGCVSVEVTPMSPPLLLTPENNSTISEQFPILSWLAPTPVKSAGSVLYDLKLVELFPNQTPYDAIQRNYAQLELTGLTKTFVQYPVTATRLDSSKKYAWFVKARGSDGSLIGETEVWSFGYSIASGAEEQNNQRTHHYVRLRKEMGTNYTLFYEDLRFVYHEQYDSSYLKAKIVRVEDNSLADEITLGGTKRGDNPFSIPIDKIKGLKINQLYRLEVISSRKETLYLLFKINK